MRKYLGWVAVGGISLGIVSSVLGVAVGADLTRGLSWARLFSSTESCPTDSDLGTEASERRLSWSGDNDVVIAVPANVYYRGGDGDDVIVRGPANLIEHIQLEGSSIGWACRYSLGSKRVEITLPGQVFDSVTIAGSSRVTMENVDQSGLELIIAGSGSFDAQGTSESVEVSIAGSGDANLANLDMDRLDVHIAGSGNTEAAPADSADITIMGSGDVKLLSRPGRIETNIMGSGRVVHAETKDL